MKERFIILCITILSLEIAIQSIDLGLSLFDKLYGLLGGLIVIIVSMVIHQMGKTTRGFHHLSIVLSMIGTGFVTSAYYRFYNHQILHQDMMTVRIVLIVTMILFLLITLLKPSENVLIAIITLSVIGAYLYTIINWVKLDSQLYSQLFFLLHIVLFYCIAYLYIKKSKEDMMRYLSFAGFGVFITVLFVVILIVSEGEGAELVVTIPDIADKKDEL